MSEKESQGSVGTHPTANHVLKPVGTYHKKNAQGSVGTHSTTKRVTTKRMLKPLQMSEQRATFSNLLGKGASTHYHLLRKKFEASISRNRLIIVDALGAGETLVASKKPSRYTRTRYWSNWVTQSTT